MSLEKGNHSILAIRAIVGCGVFLAYRGIVGSFFDICSVIANIQTKRQII
jgi:hypothetical protein